MRHLEISFVINFPPCAPQLESAQIKVGKSYHHFESISTFVPPEGGEIETRTLPWLTSKPSCPDTLGQILLHVQTLFLGEGRRRRGEGGRRRRRRRRRGTTPFLIGEFFRWFLRFKNDPIEIAVAIFNAPFISAFEIWFPSRLLISNN